MKCLLFLFFVACFSVQLSAQFLELMRSEIAQFDVHQTFAFFDMGLTEEEEQILQALVVVNRSVLLLYGNPTDIKSQIMKFLQSLGNNRELVQQAAEIIYGMIIQVHQAYGSDAVVVVLRPMQSTDKFDIPRWYYDGLHDAILQGIETKCVCALKVPGTLFAQLSADKRTDFINFFKQLHRQQEGMFLQEKNKKGFDLEVCQKVAALIDLNKIQQTQTCQGTVFAIGDADTAAIHFEPAIHEDRLFLAIIPGTHEHIAYLQELEI